MKRSRWLSGAVAVAACLLISACKAPYSNPSEALKESDLAGTWEVRYMEWGVDRLTLRADGTFKQVYQDKTATDYIYETPWNRWWLERSPDGRVRLHLEGARYYLAGIETAEAEGMCPPCPPDQPDCWGGSPPPPREFYDPIAKQLVTMVRELVLNVRSDSGRIVLMHMWTGSDRGFAMVGGRSEEFHRVDTPRSGRSVQAECGPECTASVNSA